LDRYCIEKVKKMAGMEEKKGRMKGCRGGVPEKWDFLRWK